MDLDKLFVAAIIADGPKALSYAKEEGVKPEDLNGEGREAYDFVLKYAEQYGSVPPAVALYGRTGIELEPTDLPSQFVTDEIVNRRLSNKLREKLAKPIDKLDSRDPRGAVEELEKILSELRRERIVSSKAMKMSDLSASVIDQYERMKRGERGIPFPWKTLTEETLGMWPEDLIIIVARTSIGKCVSEDTELVDPRTGVPTTIRRVVENAEYDRTWTWSKTEGVHAVPITAKVDTGTKRCLKVSLSSGRSVVVTPEHPLLTPEGWRRADEVLKGCTIGLPSRVPFAEKCVSLPEHEVGMLALLLSEGSYTGNHVGFSTTDPEILSKARVWATSMGGVEVVHRAGCDYDFVRTANSGQNPVSEMLRRLGIDDILAKNKTIPDEIYRLNREQLIQFLSVFWMCDGSIEDTGPSVTLASEKMVRQIQHLLLRLGVQSSVKYRVAKLNGKKFDAWRLRVYSQSFNKFKSLCLWGEKASRLERLCSRTRSMSSGLPVMSEEFVKTVKSQSNNGWIGGKRDARMRRVAERLGRTVFSPKDLFGKNRQLKLESFRVFCEEIGSTAEYSWLWSSDLFWDDVVCIEDAGERKIYDLTVEPTSCFIANDIVVHNTWATILTARAAWLAGKRVLVATTEMTKERIASRFHAIHLMLPYYDMRRGQLTAMSEERLYKGSQELKNDDDRLWVVGGDFDYRVESFAAALEETRPDLAVLDGAYLLKVAGKDRIERAAMAFDELKRMAHRYHVPIVTTTQFNRSVKSDQKDVGGLEAMALTDVAGWNASLVIALHQTKEMKDQKRMSIQVIKARESDGTKIDCTWNLETMDFQELSTAGGGGGDADEFGSPLDPDAGPSVEKTDDYPF